MKKLLEAVLKRNPKRKRGINTKGISVPRLRFGLPSESVGPLLLFSIVLLPLSASGAEPADVVIRNGKIVTVDSDFRIVEAMAVCDQRIAAVGIP